jgi:hypothetical protein
MDSSAARQMPIQEFQNILRTRSIVITDSTTERLPFTLQGLGQLADVDHQMDIQGDLSSPVLHASPLTNTRCRPNNPGS